MPEYRPGGCWKRTIVKVGTGPADERGRRPDDELMGLMDDPELAARICALLNADDARAAGAATADQPPAATTPSNIRVEINADGRHIVVEAPGQPDQLIDVALTTWRNTSSPDRKPLEAGSGFQLVERAGATDYSDGYPSAVSPGPESA